MTSKSIYASEPTPLFLQTNFMYDVFRLYYYKRILSQCKGVGDGLTSQAEPDHFSNP